MTRLPKILYEDDNVVVFNKPAGMMVHGDGRSPKESEASDGASTRETLADILMEKFPERKDIGEPMRVVDSEGNLKTIYRPGIVHRLDKDTTGALVVAKNEATFKFLKEQFQNRSVEKTYLALVYGIPKTQKGVIDRPIARSAGDFRKWSATRGSRGEKREAVTQYRVVGKYEDKEGRQMALLEVSPKTGRTHQIRVHLKAVNHPVVGDALYAGKLAQGSGFGRPALHASKISFLSHGKGSVTAEAPPPPDFSDYLAGLKKV